MPVVGTESWKRNLALLGEKGKEKVISLRKISSIAQKNRKVTSAPVAEQS
jgi:hypothetical protein